MAIAKTQFSFLSLKGFADLQTANIPFGLNHGVGALIFKHCNA